MDDAELAALQAALLNALLGASSPEQALALLADASLAEWARRWIAASDPRSIETAMVLVRRWTELHQDPAGSLSGEGSAPRDTSPHQDDPT
ncbi:MAG: hypothetical protein ABI895_11570 [Deltaproteobacteria bacterium]